jgi:hypothetical protein
VNIPAHSTYDRILNPACFPFQRVSFSYNILCKVKSFLENSLQSTKSLSEILEMRLQNSCERRRGHSVTTISLYIQCGICVTILQLNSFVDAFAPACSSQEKKCEGSVFPRRPTLSTMNSISLGKTKGRGKQHFARNKMDDFDNNVEDNFAMRMASYQHEEDQEALDDHNGYNISSEALNEEETLWDRRNFLQGMVTATAAGLAMPSSSNAFEKAYPVTLDFENNDSSRNLETIREQRISVQKAKVKQSKDDLLQQPLMFRNGEDVIGSVAWGGALWFLLGSRSNPLVKPIANALYDTNTKKGAWVKDRNDGLFAPFPAAFSILMGVVFVLLGVFTDRTLLLFSDGDSNGVLQLAGVTLIGGASTELGRIASGEKMKTRDDAERDSNLAEEFEEFSSKKLVYGQGGDVHRSEVIRSFRRYFAKYRVENDQFPLGDVEIEALLRAWNKRSGNQETMSSSGFIRNVKINSQAEIKM